MSKQTESLKLARDFISAEWGFGGTTDIEPSKLVRMLDEALAEQPAQGCEFCSHPLYAGTKCKNCGKPAQQQEIPKIGCVNHDCDKCKKAQQEPVAWAWRNTKTDGRGIYWENPAQFYDLSKPSDYEWTPLYTSPQPSTPWVGLTEEETGHWAADFLAGAKWAEAKLREKNNG